MIGVRGVCLGWVHGGTVRAEFLDSVLGLVGTPPTDRMVSRYETFTAGAHIAQARNAVAAQFLTRGGEPWLWMLDTDMCFEPTLLMRLAMQADPDTRPVLSALYWTTTAGGLPLVPVAYTRNPDPAAAREFVSTTPPPGKVTRVDGVGAGCLLIHRRVLDGIAAGGRYPGWFSEITQDGRFVGEDLSFCLRAAACGYPVHVDAGAVPGHVKTVTVGVPGGLDAPPG